MRTRDLVLIGSLVTCCVAVGCSTGGMGPGSGGGGSGNKANPGSAMGGGSAGSGAAWGFPGASAGGAGGGPSDTGGAGTGAGSGFTPGIVLPPACEWDPPPAQVVLSLPRTRPMTSAPFARSLTGKLPDPGRVRADELLNYYRVRYPALEKTADEKATIAAAAGIAPGLLAGQWVVQVAVQAPSVAPTRVPIEVAAVIDTSASMGSAGLARAKQAAQALIAGLRAGDAFALFTSAGATSAPIVVLSDGDRDAARALVEAAIIDDAGSLADALDLAYKSAEAATAHLGTTAKGRVALITNGAAQATSLHLGTVATGYLNGVELIGVGIGDAMSTRSDMLEIATANGGGVNVLLDTDAEADMLRQRFEELMTLTATDVKVTLELPTDFLRPVSVDAAGASLGPPSTLQLGGLGAGRALVFRQVFETCLTGAQMKELGAKFGVSVAWQEAAGADLVPLEPLKGALSGLVGATDPQIRAANIIQAYAEGLANVRPGPLLDAWNELAKLTLDPQADPELSDVKTQVQKFLCLPTLLDGGACPAAGK